ncbi:MULTISPECIES: UbiA family prenyltransferase [Streptosporangium]|uniref:4-hydroxybenzoate polyprenyltransferase n=1 Tax=Streptosporangium brasiliense TaxID=47480 RepID=A0ABT9RFD6_9ACTN|nr:UbiA family prenyltransferase [Streptosporangium brasiliense]MDP9867999.1 4-hydroxybenzoate polyprenyltransferase [Streptosporangium brasiliense]
MTFSGGSGQAVTAGSRQAHRPAARPAALSRVLHEAVVTWRFVYRDLSSTVIPVWLFGGAAAVHHGLPPASALAAAGRSTVWALLYLYTFCVSNQISGVEEDRVNKPDRPLASGAVTVAGAWLRWWAATAAFAVTGLLLGVPGWTFAWLAVTVLHNFAGWSRWGPAKNLCMVLGTIVQLAAAWTTAGPLDGTAWRWILAVSVIIGGAGMHVQDLRDMAGDRLAGRRTLPLLFGEDATRRHLAVVMAAMPLLLAPVLYAPEGEPLTAAVCAFFLATVCWRIAWRVIRLRGAGDDHRTYMLYTYMFCYVLLSGMFVL